MSLIQIAGLLGATGVDANAWASDAEQRAEKVSLFRQYTEGDHRAKLTTEMANLLRVNKNNSMTQFNANHMGIIVDTMADRLHVEKVSAQDETVTAWATDLLRANRFDALQEDVHRATCRDGDTFLVVDYDSGSGRVRLTHQPVYDNLGGMLAVYDEPGRMVCAVKIWSTTTKTLGDTTRVNVYYADRIEKYIGGSVGAMEKYSDDGETWPLPWRGRDGKPLGIPVFHFRNRGAEYNDFGQSELEDAIPLQDALNRILYSAVMTAEYSAFPIRVAVGVKPPEATTPGMWVSVYPKSNDGTVLDPTKDEIDLYKAVRFETMPAAELTSYIQTAEWIEEQIYAVTNTPRTVGEAAAASGESQKQREVKLLGKVRSFQTKIGNVWEDALALALRVEAAFGKQTLTTGEFNAVWRSAEVRDERLIVENAEKVREFIPLREYYRLIAPAFGWDEAKIEQMVEEMGQSETNRLAGVRSLLPSMGNFDLASVRQELPA